MKPILSTFLALTLVLSAGPAGASSGTYNDVECRGMTLPTSKDLSALALMQPSPVVKESALYQTFQKQFTEFYAALLRAEATDRMEEFVSLASFCVPDAQQIQFLNEGQMSRVLPPEQMAEFRKLMQARSLDPLDSTLGYVTLGGLTILSVGAFIVTVSLVFSPVMTAGTIVALVGTATLGGAGTWALGRWTRTQYRTYTVKKLTSDQQGQIDALAAQIATSQLDALTGSQLGPAVVRP